MSGGSYNYLYLEIEDRLESLKSFVKDEEDYPFDECLSEMIRNCKEQFPEVHGTLVSKQNEILSLVNKLESVIDKEFLDLLQAVEWYESGDWGEESIKDRLGRVREKTVKGATQ